MSDNTYVPGDWNATCDRCGRKFKASQLSRTWDNLMVCSRDWEPRHPQDFVRGVPDTEAPPWTRPQPATSYVAVCTLQGSSAIPGYATPGCAIPSRPDLTNT